MQTKEQEDHKEAISVRCSKSVARAEPPVACSERWKRGTKPFKDQYAIHRTRKSSCRLQNIAIKLKSFLLRTLSFGFPFPQPQKAALCYHRAFVM